MRLIKGAPPEDVEPERTLHPTVSLESIAHLRVHGYIVADPADLLILLAREIETGRKSTESADIARRIVNTLRRAGK